MFVKFVDTKTGEVEAYEVPDAPVRLILIEETNYVDSRFRYSVSRSPFEHARRMLFVDFVIILFFDLATQPISDNLWYWLYALVGKGTSTNDRK